MTVICTFFIEGTQGNRSWSFISDTSWVTFDPKRRKWYLLFCMCHVLSSPSCWFSVSFSVNIFFLFTVFLRNITVSVNITPTAVKINWLIYSVFFLQNVLRKRDQTQAEYEGRLEAAMLRKQEDRTPVSVRLPQKLLSHTEALKIAVFAVYIHFTLFP